MRLECSCKSESRRRFLSTLAASSSLLGLASRARAGDDLNAGGSAVTQAATKSRLAASSLMLDIARAGKRLVTVGERGRVLLSDDAGISWRQSTTVPVSITLTAVSFVDERRGWVTGHAGVVLNTVDAGETWRVQLNGVQAAQNVLAEALASDQSQPGAEGRLRAAQQLVADGPDKPFLALQFVDALRGMVVGAYGLAFSTDDGGVTWKSRIGDMVNPRGLHLNAIKSDGGHVFVVGEKGLVLRSDNGARFAAIKSPYDGSLFALGSLPGGGLLVAGLRGNAFRTDDAGESWKKVAMPVPVTLAFASRLGSGDLFLLNQSGALFRVGPNGRVVPVSLPHTAPLTALVEASDGSLVASSLRGPVRLPLSVTQTSAAVASNPSTAIASR